MDTPQAALLLCIPVLVIAYQLLQFVWLHFIHSGKLSRYAVANAINLTSNSEGRPWALVTGASDGIGFGFVEELASQNFNVILHGRNRTKLEGLVEKVQARYPSCKFRIFVLDVSKRGTWPTTITAFINDLKTSKLNLRVLINNVGGTGGGFSAFDRMVDRDADSVQSTIDMNATFPATFTPALLPILIENQPSLIINIGSVVGPFPPPYLALYAASKAFNLAWSESFALEMVAEKHDVEILGVIVGQVVTAGTAGMGDESLFAPNARVFAKATLGKVGCGRSTVTAYWPHALQVAALDLLPVQLRNRILTSASVKTMEQEKRRS